jgi:branched-chain amino acid transport system substrate-binding protein
VGERPAFKRKRRVRSPLLITVALVAILIVLSACQSMSTTPITGATSNQAPIKIGVSLSLTGDFSSDGKLTEKGYQVWAHDVNVSGGLLGRPVQLLILNDKSDAKKTGANYETLITKNRVDLLLGPFADDYTVAGGTVAKAHRYAMVDGTGNAPSTYEQGLNNTFCVSLPANDYLTSFANFVLSLPASMRPTSVAYATSDDPFTQPQVDTGKVLLDHGGVTSLLYTTYSAQNATVKDYTAAAMKIVRTGAQAVVLGTGGPADYAAYIKVFKQQHYNPRIIIGTAGPDGGSDFVSAVGGIPTAEGQLVPNGGWWPTINTFQNTQFVGSYVALYKGLPTDISSDAVQAYSVGQVLQQAVNKINSLDNARLINELASGDTFSTLQGPVTFDDKGHNTIATSFLFQWQKGHLIPVYPDSQSQANLEYPKPQWT